MSRVTAGRSVRESDILQGSTPSVPTLEQLRDLTGKAGERVVIRGVDWGFYERLVDSLPEHCHIRTNFDGKDIELMSPGPHREDAKGLLGRVVEIVAEELEVPFKSAGATTWKRPEVARGLESDESYFFRPDKLEAVAKARKSNDVADYPNPDLAVAVDVSPSKIDRPGIYAALGVTEVWRFDAENEVVIIEVLAGDRSYAVVEQSSILPIRADEIRRWVVDEETDDESAWARRLRAWVRAEVAARLLRG